MHEIYSYPLDKLEKMETDSIVLPKFDSSVAWDIGVHARKLSLEHPQPVVIDITLASGQVLFHATSRPGTLLDNDEWVKRKLRTVIRFGMSSFYIGRKLEAKQKSVEEALFVSPLEYATHGGSVPIRAEGYDGVYGALTISGLAQEQDHLLALKVLEDIKKSLKK